jgi:Fic family protein
MLCIHQTVIGEKTMIFQTPTLDDSDHAVLGMINSQRDRLRTYTQSSPNRWLGSLRRSTFARAIQGSNSIEGIHASIENVLAVVENEDPTNIERETWFSIRGYRNAMTYIIQAAQDPYFEFSKQFMKSLQFMMVGHDINKNPGQWRPGPIYVVNQSTGQTVYEGPDATTVNDLVEELVVYLESPLNNEPVIVRGSMAHLNLTMIHPFKDGNGRVSRALQTLVLAREGILAPVFCSIEEWLGRVTQEYYGVLAEVGQGQWRPERNALPWVRFCLKAHYHQAATLIRRNIEHEELFKGIDKIVKREKLDERVALPLFDASLGTPISNSWYRRDAEVSELVASRDLKKLSDLGLLMPHGEKRGRKYEAGKELKNLRDSTRQDRVPYADPYELMKDKAARNRYSSPVEPRLPGV